jgi:hypothetical protein
VNQRDFQKKLKALSDEHQGKFGYPFMSLKQIMGSFELSEKEFTKLLQQEMSQGRVVMNPIDERTLENLPATLLPLTLTGPEGEERIYVSLALKP